MSKNWIVLAVAATLVTGCGPNEEKVKAEQAAARQVEWTAVEAAKKTLDAKRAEIAAAKAEAASGADVASRLATLDSELTAVQQAFSEKLAGYINSDPPVVGEPMRPDQVAAMRLNSAEGILVAREHIELGGDYRRAIEIFQQLLVADPDNPEVKAALADAEGKRFMTEARFAAVKKGMAEAEVVAALGRPLSRNIRSYPEKQATAWFFPKDEQGNAAGVFFDAKSVVYLAKFDAIKAGGKEGEEGSGE